ncbi:MAG: tetratricopeptide repeat protein [Gemmatimonadetes bacterium]|nr:tetratricopeptide repeat protein [Gemmatimonadota bacterium]
MSRRGGGGRAEAATAAPPTGEPTERAGHESLGARERRVLTAVVLLLPLVLLAAAEGVLRLTGHGAQPRLVVPFTEVEGWLRVNPEIGRRYLPGPDPPVPAFEVFPAERRPGDVRLVFQGASTAVGFPFGVHAAPARVVENWLRELLPDRRVEVVNTGLTAVGTHTLLDLAREVAALEPDAVLVYAGHNEFYGAFGVASVTSPGRWRPLVRAYLRLDDLHLVRLLAGALERLRGGGADPRAATRMEGLAGEAIPLDGPLYRAGMAQYRANLSALLAFYRSRGIPVLVGTLVSNERDRAPFLGGPGDAVDEGAWRREMDAARDAFARGDAAAAARALDALTALDPLAADPWFLRGRLLEMAGDTAAAAEAYRAARDRDRLRFRAPGAFNEVVREVAAEHGARIVDVEAAFRAASPGGIVGGELLTEHVHPDLRGYALLGHAYLEGLREAGIPTGWEAAPAPGAPPLVTALDSVLGAYQLQGLLQSWPFQERGTTPVFRPVPETAVEDLAWRVYDGRMLWIQAVQRLASLYEERGDTERALGAALAMAAEFPVAPHFFVQAARLSLELGRVEEADALLAEARARWELPEGLRVDGEVRLRQGRREEALDLLARAAAAGDTAAAGRLDALRRDASEP